jgi:hypothetical protein
MNISLSPVRTAFKILACMVLLCACKKEDLEKIDTLKGPEVNMGNGKAASWFTVNADGVPQEIGVEMNADAFAGLTQDPTNFAASTFLLQLDQKAKQLTPFDHVVVNWNPHGHDPAGVFNIPHFDFHFYMMTETERNAIPPYMPSTAALHDNLPAAGFMPSTYKPTPGGVPQMGKHWGDEHMSMPFTHTMVYGSFNGKVNFLEPMIIKTILESGQRITTAYDQPTQFDQRGKYYPTKYNIR